MFDAYWLNPPPEGYYNSPSGVRYYRRLSVPASARAESGDNARLVVLNDAQLSCIMAALSVADYSSNWVTHYATSSDQIWILPDSPLGQRVTSFPFAKSPQRREFQSEYEGSLAEEFEISRNLFLSELREQLMVDVRPELNEMINAQNEMSDDLDAIRIHLQTIAESIDGTAAEKLEDIVNALGLLVALL